MRTPLLIWINLFLMVSTARGENFSFPDSEGRARWVATMAAEMKRLDGDALFVRQNRSESWDSTVARLVEEARLAADPRALARVFARLNATYPNLHSSVELSPSWAALLVENRERPAVTFAPEELGRSSPRFRIVNVRVPQTDLRAGDTLVAINGISIKKWREENIIFCKWPLATQCDGELYENLVKGLLAWEPGTPLRYTVSRPEGQREVFVPFVPRVPRQRPYRGCGGETYPGFVLSYEGNQACIFTSPQTPGTAILRIKSFQYRNVPADASIRTIEHEVSALSRWWRDHARWEHLIVDVMSNGGGQAPIPYYKLIFTKPFQEQYVRFRKSPELDDSALRKALFWESSGHELWFQNLVRTGAYARTTPGAFLPPVPMFCADETRPCNEGRFVPDEHPFRGRVTLLVDRYCISSCDGFVFALKENLPGRVRIVGEPQAADSAFSRLTIDLLDSGKTKVRPISTEPTPGTIVSQIVSATRSVNAAGMVVSGRPTMVDLPVHERWDEEDWRAAVIRAALQK